MNPLRQIHDGIWDLLEARADLMALVLEDSRRKYYDADDERGEPERDNVGAGTLPELRVFQTGHDVQPHLDTKDVKVTMNWAVQITTGERMQNTLLDVQWATIRALIDWSSLEALTWQDEEFVKATRVFTMKDSLDNKELNRGQRGWASVWQCEMVCVFNRSYMTGTGT